MRKRLPAKTSTLHHVQLRLMHTLIFYTTDSCHLCKQAEVLLQELQARHDFILESVDIAADASLVERYGIRIPVVKNALTLEERGWPFHLADLLALI